MRRFTGRPTMDASEAIKALVVGHATVDVTDRQGITPAHERDRAQADGCRESAARGPTRTRKKTDFTGRDSFGWAAGQPAVLRMLQEPQSKS